MSLTRREFLLTASASAVVAQIPGSDRLAKFKALTNAIPPGEWRQIPNSSILSVLSKRAEAPNDGATNGPTAVIYSWNGAAYDSNRHRWYFHGGGHTDYSGNEVYMFDFEELRWERLTKPSPIAVDGDPSKQSSYHTTDGTPLSSHTYDGLVFCPLTGTLFVWLGSLYRTGAMSDDLWEFDPNRKKWTFITSLPKGVNRAPPSAKWSDKHKKILFFAFGIAMWFDPVTKSYGPRSGYYGFTDAGCGAIDDADDAYYFLMGGIIKVALTEPAPKTGIELVPGRYGQRAPNIDAILSYNSGMTWDPKRKHLLIWDGGSGLNTFDPATGKFGVYPVTGPAPAPVNRHVYSKWQYIAELDVFAGYDDVDQGIWIWKPASNPPIAVLPQLNTVTVTNADGSNPKTYNTFEQAAAAVKDGQTITIKSGDHDDGGIVKANKVLIRGEPGAHLMDRTQEGGIGVLVIRGNDCIVENLTISGGTGQGNTSAIRFLGKNLTLRKCHLHHSNMNFLSGGDNGDIVMEDCVIEDSVPQGQYSHNIYIGENSQGVAHSFTMRRCKSLRANGLGHLVKSRAFRTTIENCTLAMIDANSSRCIDVSDGGIVVIRANVIEVGPKSDNNDAIGIALENAGDVANGHPGVAIKDSSGNWIANPAFTHSTLIEGNLIINDMRDYAYHGGRVMVVHSRSPKDTILKNNIFVSSLTHAELGWQDKGDGRIVDNGGNKILPSRSAAGLQSYPYLPSGPKG